MCCLVVFKLLSLQAPPVTFLFLTVAMTSIIQDHSKLHFLPIPLPGDMTVEELLEKYKGAYASDFEEPSASASPASTEESENSGDEEEESEEEESDVESNTTSSGTAHTHNVGTSFLSNLAKALGSFTL